MIKDIYVPPDLLGYEEEQAELLFQFLALHHL